MKTWKRLFSIALVLGVAATHAPGTATAPVPGWVDTFATVSGAQHQPGTIMHVDFGVQNDSNLSQDLILAGIIRFADGSRMVIQPRESMTLASGEGVIRFATVILPQTAPIGPARFVVGAYVRGLEPDLQGPRIVYDSDAFAVVR